MLRSKCLIFQVAPEHADQMRLQQLKLYETLLGGSAERARQLLSHQPFLRPLLDLLNQFADAKTESKCFITSYDSTIFYYQTLYRFGDISLKHFFERPNLTICCNLTENLSSLVTVRTKKGFVANPRKSMGIEKHKLSRVGFNIRVP